MNYYSLLNLPVIQYPRGRKIGAVTDIYLKKGSNEVLGIIATNRSLLYQHRLYKPTDIIKADVHSISVIGPGIKFLKVPKGDFLSFKNMIGARTLAEEKMKYLGQIKDGNFDMELGYLSEILLGGSIADDILNGRKILRTDSIKEKGGFLFAKDPLIFEKSKGLRAISERSNKRESD